MGVDEPDYGHLLDDMFVFEDRTSSPRPSLLSPGRGRSGLHPERGAPRARAATWPTCCAATAYVVPALEIIDSRIADWKISLCDTIADNASSCRVVLGGQATRSTRSTCGRSAPPCAGTATVIATGNTGAVLGNPCTAVAWLANKVHRFGVTLEAGHVILPGSCTRAYDVAPGRQPHVPTSTSLGDVSINFS